MKKPPAAHYNKTKSCAGKRNAASISYVLHNARFSIFPKRRPVPWNRRKLSLYNIFFYSAVKLALLPDERSAKANE